METGYFYLTKNLDEYKFEIIGKPGNIIYQFKLNEEFEGVGFDGHKHKIKFVVENEDFVEVHEYLDGPRKEKPRVEHDSMMSHGLVVPRNEMKMF
uniref:Uncharacterized protein n=1 Tax=Acrobeloides nanus TaxID=290746 RepID=A0A914EFR1_9BILA